MNGGGVKPQGFITSALSRRRCCSIPFQTYGRIDGGMSPWSYRGCIPRGLGLGPPVSPDQCRAHLPRSAPVAPTHHCEMRLRRARPRQNEREAFLPTQNIRMRDIWKTSNKLERQGSTKLIWFAPGLSEKPLAFTARRGALARSKEGGPPCIQGPLSLY